MLRKLFKGENYSRAETVWGNTVFRFYANFFPILPKLSRLLPRFFRNFISFFLNLMHQSFTIQIFSGTKNRLTRGLAVLLLWKKYWILYLEFSGHTAWRPLFFSGGVCRLWLMIEVNQEPLLSSGLELIAVAICHTPHRCTVVHVGIKN